VLERQCLYRSPHPDSGWLRWVAIDALEIFERIDLLRSSLLNLNPHQLSQTHSLTSYCVTPVTLVTSESQQDWNGVRANRVGRDLLPPVTPAACCYNHSDHLKRPQPKHRAFGFGL